MPRPPRSLPSRPMEARHEIPRSDGSRPAAAGSQPARRLQTIGVLNTRVANARGLTASDRSALAATLSSDRSGLTALRAKLDAETALQAALSDAREIFAGYRVYAVVDLQVRMAIAADTLTTACNGKLSQVEQSLAALVTGSSSADAQAKLA